MPRLGTTGTLGIATVFWCLACQANQPAVLPTEGHAFDVEFSPNGKIMAVAANRLGVTWWTGQRRRNPSYYIALYEVPTGRAIGMLDFPGSDPAGAQNVMAFSPDGSLFVACDRAKRQIRVWETGTWREQEAVGRFTMAYRPRVGKDNKSLYFLFKPSAEDGREIEHRGDRALLVWDIERRQRLGVIENTGGYHLTHDGTLSTTHFDRSRKRWLTVVRDAATFKEDTRLDNARLEAGTPQGSLLCADDMVRRFLWEPDENRKLKIDWFEQLGVHPNSVVVTTRFSDDGELLASGPGWSSSGNIKDTPQTRVLLWNVKAGKFICSLIAPRGQGVGDIAFSPEAKLLAATVWLNQTNGPPYRKAFDPRDGPTLYVWTLKRQYGKSNSQYERGN